jgi:hypothetical protein
MSCALQSACRCFVRGENPTIRRGIDLRRPRFALACLALVAVLAVPAAAVAASNPAVNVSLSSQADWISPAQIVVYATFSCAPFFAGTAPGTGFVEVTVNQAASTTPGGVGSGFQGLITCDNQNHRVAISVTPGPWQLGPAIASVFACGFTCDTQVKQIKITRA